MSGSNGPVEPPGAVGAASDASSDTTAAIDPHEKRERLKFRLEVAGVSLAVVGIGLAALQVRYAAWPVVPEPPAPIASLEDAIALATNGRSAEAVEVFKRLAAADPKNPVVHANACGLYLEMNYLVEARQACLAAVLNGGSNWLANYNNACLLAREGRINEAIEALRRALATVGDDAAAKLTRASLAQRATGDRMLQNLRDNAQFKKLTATR